MKIEFTENGIEIRAENWAKSHALMALFPVGDTTEDWLKRIVIHTAPDKD